MVKIILIIITGIISYILNMYFFHFSYPDIPFNYIISILGLIIIGNLYSVIPLPTSKENIIDNEIFASIMVSIIRGVLFITFTSKLSITLVFVVTDIMLSYMFGKVYLQRRIGKKEEKKTRE